MCCCSCLVREACSAKRGSESGHGPTKASGERWGTGEGKQCPSTQTEPKVHVAAILLKPTQFCYSVFLNIVVQMLPMWVHRGFVHSVLCILCLAFAFSLPKSYESSVTHVIMVQEPFMCKGI